MAHEVAIVEYLGFDGAGGKRRRTIASGAVVPINSVMVFSDPNTVAVMVDNDENKAFGGIAAEAKKGDGEDYTTRLTVYTDIVVDAFASAAIGFGNEVVLSDTTNFFAAAPAHTSGTVVNAVSGAAIAGRTEETATDNEQIRMRLQA